MTSEEQRAAIALELRHAKSALAGVEARRHRSLPGLLGAKFSASGLLGAADIAVVSRAAIYRDLADYERTWAATPDVTKAAFAELTPMIDRVTLHLVATGWVSPP